MEVAQLIVSYFLTGEIYAMGRGIFLFVGGPLAGLIASIPYGHRVFYAVNALQAMTVTLLFFSAWIRVFTVSQDFWACVETSVSIFVVPSPLLQPETSMCFCSISKGLGLTIHPEIKISTPFLKAPSS